MSAGDHFYLDKADPGSWRALNGLARKVAAAAEDAENADPGTEEE